MRRALACAFALLALAAGRAFAEGLYLTEPQLAAQLFPEASQVSARELELNDAEVAQAQRILGHTLDARRYRCLTLADASGTKGTIFILDVLGQNAPITFGVGVAADGSIRGVEVVAYREPRGDEIRAKRFLRQLSGKSLRDPIALGEDVDTVTGATISSRSATYAARKALALAAVLRGRGAPLRAEAAHPAQAMLGPGSGAPQAKLGSRR